MEVQGDFNCLSSYDAKKLIAVCQSGGVIDSTSFIEKTGLTPEQFKSCSCRGGGSKRRTLQRIHSFMNESPSSSVKEEKLQFRVTPSPSLSSYGPTSATSLAELQQDFDESDSDEAVEVIPQQQQQLPSGVECIAAATAVARCLQTSFGDTGASEALQQRQEQTSQPLLQPRFHSDEIVEVKPPLERIFPESGWIGSVDCSPDGRRIVTASLTEMTAKLWDAHTSACVMTLVGHTDKIRSVAYSLNGSRIVTASRDKTAKIWDAITGDCVMTLVGHTDTVISASFSPDDRHVVTGSWDKTANIWAVMTGGCSGTMRGHTDFVAAAVFSPNGRFVVTGSWDMTAINWGVDGNRLRTLDGHSGAVLSASYSHDGLHIVTASRDKTVKVWEVDSGSCLRTLFGHSRAVNYVTFIRDSRYIASGSDDATVKIWVANTGICAITLPSGNDDDSVSTVAANESLLVADNCTLKIWGVDAITLLSRRHDELQRVLSNDVSIQLLLSNQRDLQGGGGS